MRWSQEVEALAVISPVTSTMHVSLLAYLWLRRQWALTVINGNYALNGWHLTRMHESSVSQCRHNGDLCEPHCPHLIFSGKQSKFDHSSPCGREETTWFSTEVSVMIDQVQLTEGTTMIMISQQMSNGQGLYSRSFKLRQPEHWSFSTVQFSSVQFIK